MTHQIVPDQDHPKRRPAIQLSQLRKPPIGPGAAQGVDLLASRLGKRLQNLGQLLFEPRMQNGIGGLLNRTGTHLPIGRMKQGQQFCRPPSDILVGVASGIAFFLPGRAGLRDGLVRTGFVFGPDGNARFLG